MVEHEFTATIKEILNKYFAEKSDDVFSKSPLIQYLNIKTKSANRGSKSRGAFANHYALYVLIEDYVNNGFSDSGDYTTYSGAKYLDLFNRQRQLPFGSKLQNHALNHRLNEEFKKYFKTIDAPPILRNPETNRYWINQKLIQITVDGKRIDLSQAILEIIDSYVDAKKDSFENFIHDCKKISQLGNQEPQKAISFILDLIRPNIDARIFEIVSYAILKEVYAEQKIFWGFQADTLHQEELKLYKTGRTNANDGGIDFVMKPLGRFFQVTETTDVKKYFLDIDKVERFPITFVVKSEDSVESLKSAIAKQAKQLFPVDAIVKKYMDCIEEIINIEHLRKDLDTVVKRNKLSMVVDEILKQSMVEFNYDKSDI